jgi:hypothetical protein
MAFKKFEADRNETHDWSKEGVLEGVYLSKRNIPTINGDSWLYTVEKKGGVKVDVWGKAMLDNFFQNIPIGSLVRITYKGKMKSAKGGRTYHAFDLEYDDSAVEKEDITPEQVEEIFKE